MNRSPVSKPEGLKKERALHLLREMLRIRRFEEKAAELYSLTKIRGFLHLYIGEEAVAVGAMQALTDQDAIVATYREHGHALARGVPMSPLMAELYGKANGCSRGRGGSMHFYDASRRFFGGYAIVGEGLPVAVGLALADKLQERASVTACFFGDGAVAEGEFHESLNLAALWKLPVLFLCENNLYAMGTALARHQSQTDISLKSQGYGIPSEAVDGMDVLAVESATQRALQQVRQGMGPYLLEYRTYRFRAHSMYDPELYRSKEEVAQWKERDPIITFEKQLRKRGILTDEDLGKLEAAVSDEVDEAVAFAEAGPWEPVEDLLKDVYSPISVQTHEVKKEAAEIEKKEIPGQTKVTYREAVRAGLREALKSDPRVFLMGEDVGRYGGAYACSKGLLEEFGPERVRDTPLSESTFVGAGIGAALGGMRPIVEVMTINFSLLALDQIVNNAATLRHMSGGQFSVPLIIRMATGAGRQVAAQHSHSLEGWYAHIPGIKVLTPATVEDAKGMLLAALKEPNPVFIFEHAFLYPMQSEWNADAGPVNIDKALIRRPGKDITLITYGGSLWKGLEAADRLAEEGIEVEVLDLRILRPLDTPTILTSIAKTHRAIVVDEGWKTGSFASEITARIMEEAFYNLDGPVARVCSAEVPIPYAKHMEEAALPQADTIIKTIREMLQSHG